MTDPLVPTGVWSLPLRHLLDLVADCPAWAEWCEAGDPARAAERLHLVDLPPAAVGEDRPYTVDELQDLRPFGLARQADADTSGLSLTGIADGDYLQGGTLWLVIEDNAGADDRGDPAASQVRFTNRVGDLLEQMAGRAGLDGRLAIKRLDVLGPFRAAVEDVPTLGDYWGVMVKVSYGV